jgi:cytochrome c-type biogenesis protein CcmH
MKRWLWALLCCASLAWAQGPAASVPDATLDAHVLALAAQLRCIVCQNESLADSQAPLAADLREQIRRQLREGRSDEQIRAYMTERYGDFVLYEPPLSARTWLLWFGPLLMLAIGGLALWRVLRARQRLPEDAFEDADDGDAVTH